MSRIEQQRRYRILPTPDARRLVRIPGIGPLVACALLLGIDDITPSPISIADQHYFD